jgi:hypothetical protein
MTEFENKKASSADRLKRLLNRPVLFQVRLCARNRPFSHASVPPPKIGVAEAELEDRQVRHGNGDSIAPDNGCQPREPLGLAVS